MPLTQTSILKALKNICRRIDKKHPKIKFVHKGKTRKMRGYYDLLKMDANMAGLTKYLLAEINDYKLKNPSNQSNYVPKHQLVHILKSFVCADSDKESAQPNYVARLVASQQVPVGSSPEKEAYIKPVIEGIADFMIATQKWR